MLLCIPLLMSVWIIHFIRLVDLAHKTVAEFEHFYEIWRVEVTFCLVIIYKTAHRSEHILQHFFLCVVCVKLIGRDRRIIIKRCHIIEWPVQLAVHISSCNESLDTEWKRHTVELAVCGLHCLDDIGHKRVSVTVGILLHIGIEVCESVLAAQCEEIADINVIYHVGSFIFQHSHTERTFCIGIIFYFLDLDTIVRMSGIEFIYRPYRKPVSSLCAADSHALYIGKFRRVAACELFQPVVTELRASVCVDPDELVISKRYNVHCLSVGVHPVDDLLAFAVVSNAVESVITGNKQAIFSIPCWRLIRLHRIAFFVCGVKGGERFAVFVYIAVADLCGIVFIPVSFADLVDNGDTGNELSVTVTQIRNISFDIIYTG